MEFRPELKISRREMLRIAAAWTGGAVAAPFFPPYLLGAAIPPADDPVAASRARFATVPIEKQRLADHISLLSGPGGNVVVLDGPDGKLVGDTFVQPAWPHFREALDAIGNAPLKIAVDTHWHFDHSDNNGALHAAGATVIAHENTRKHMSQTNVMPVLNMTVSPWPADALPKQVFQQTHKIDMNGETITLIHVAPAHTDSDIFLHFEKANVVQAGDVYFNGTYPYIDSGTGGSVSGTISGLNKLLAMTGNDTKIVPGHGPLGNKADVMRFRDMLSTVRHRLQKFKAAGKPVQEAVAAKPLKDLDDPWGQGLNDSDTFVQIAYLAL